MARRQSRHGSLLPCLWERTDSLKTFLQVAHGLSALSRRLSKHLSEETKLAILSIPCSSNPHLAYRGENPLPPVNTVLDPGLPNTWDSGDCPFCLSFSHLFLETCGSGGGSWREWSPAASARRWWVDAESSVEVPSAVLGQRPRVHLQVAWPRAHITTRADSRGRSLRFVLLTNVQVGLMQVSPGLLETSARPCGSCHMPALKLYF